LPVVVVPSLASTDAPCTALSVVYSDAGVVEEVVYFPTSPAMVVVDTTVIAEAPSVYLVAGMGDAMATWWVQLNTYDGDTTQQGHSRGTA
jgi:glycerol dehydrogenase